MQGQTFAGMSGTKRMGGGTADVEDDVKDFLSNVEKSAKRILRDHNRKKLLESAKEKADRARRRAWEDSSGSGAANSMLLEGTIRPDTVSMLMTGGFAGGTTASLPPLSASASSSRFSGTGPLGDTAGSAQSAFPTLQTEKMRSKSATQFTPMQSGKVTKQLEELTKNPLATSTFRLLPPVYACMHYDL